ncbi:MAG: PAC2 family protein [Egibacteraceae bacterium]
MGGLIDWHGELPRLRRPMLLTALEGFVDSGAAASTAGLFLRHRWKSEVVATFDRDAFIDFRARRPSVVVSGGVVRRVEWPEIELLVATLDGPHDALLLMGYEPDMGWEAFCDTVAKLCEQTGVERMISLGAYPAAVPHTRPVRILHAVNMAAEDLPTDLPAAPDYTGPIGIGTMLQDALASVDIPAIGLWAEIPHYIATSPNPSGALALAQAVAGMFGTVIDTTELEAASKLHIEQVGRAVAEHEDARHMVKALEVHVDLGDEDDGLPTGEDIAAEIERFFRQQPG